MVPTVGPPLPRTPAAQREGPCIPVMAMGQAGGHGKQERRGGMEEAVVGFKMTSGWFHSDAGVHVLATQGLTQICIPSV